MKKVKKIIALLLALTMFVGVNTTYVDAEEVKCCGRSILFEDGSQREIVNWSYGVAHPLMVDGKLVSCKSHYYTYRIPVYCDLCGTFLYYKYGYNELHQYSHN